MNEHLRKASEILFNDPEFALQDWMATQLDYWFVHPTEGRKVTINSLAAELKDQA